MRAGVPCAAIAPFIQLPSTSSLLNYTMFFLLPYSSIGGISYHVVVVLNVLIVDSTVLMERGWQWEKLLIADRTKMVLLLRPLWTNVPQIFTATTGTLNAVMSLFCQRPPTISWIWLPYHVLVWNYCIWMEWQKQSLAANCHMEKHKMHQSAVQGYNNLDGFNYH